MAGPASGGSSSSSGSGCSCPNCPTASCCFSFTISGVGTTACCTAVNANWKVYLDTSFTFYCFYESGITDPCEGFDYWELYYSSGTTWFLSCSEGFYFTCTTFDCNNGGLFTFSGNFGSCTGPFPSSVQVSPCAGSTSSIASSTSSNSSSSSNVISSSSTTSSSSSSSSSIGCPCCCCGSSSSSSSSSSNSTVSPSGILYVNAWYWLPESSDVLNTVELSISSGEGSTGTIYYDATALAPISSTLVEDPNADGYYVWEYTFQLNAPLILSSGTYWLNFQNAVSSGSDPVYWDESSGPSMGYSNELGTIPSESFQLLNPSNVIIYDNLNGSTFNTTAYTINTGYIVSSSFTV